MMIGGLACALGLVRLKQLPGAMLMALITLNNTAAFVTSDYGPNHPANAAFMISIVLAGLTVGGLFLSLWYAITVASFLFSMVEGAKVPLSQWPSLLVWVLAFGIVALLTSRFTSEIDRLFVESNEAKKREQTQLVAERTRISRDIHDTLAQGFTGILMQLNAAESQIGKGDVAREHLDKARGLAVSSLNEARNSVWALRPESSPEVDIVESIHKMVHNLSPAYGLVASIEVQDNLPTIDFSTAYEATRIVQEALTNIVRHSGTAEADISICFQNGLLRLEISDNGRGLESDIPEGFGIVGMRERAERIGGRLSIESGMNGGTKVTLWLKNGKS